MKALDIDVFLRLIRVSGIERGRTYVKGQCPFGRWRHSGVDRNPSFGVRINDAGLSRYNCFGCRSHGTLQNLVWELERLSGHDNPEAHRFLQLTETVGVEASRTRLAELTKRIESSSWAGATVSAASGPPLVLKAPEEVKLDEVTLEFYFNDLPPECVRWPVIAKRTILLETYARWGVRFHPDTGRIVLPVRDRAGVLRGITGRLVSDDHCVCGGLFVRVTKQNKPQVQCANCNRKKGPKYLHTTGFRRDSYLYGEHMVPAGKPRGGLVEGHFDAQAVSQIGLPTVAAMGSFLSPTQVRKVSELFSSVVILRDGDDRGLEIAEAYRAALAGHLPVDIAPVPMGSDPDEVDPQALAELAGVDTLPEGLIVSIERQRSHAQPRQDPCDPALDCADSEW